MTATEPLADISFIANRPLTAQERRVIRAGLKLYAARMEQRAKQLAEDECPNGIQSAIVLQIRGNDHQQGLLGVFTEQMSIEDQAQLTLDDARRALEASASACANAMIDMPDFPPTGEYVDELKRFVRTWSEEQREVATKYALAAAELKENEVMTEPMPERVRQALARAREWTMTDADREHWLHRGPWEVAWENDIAEGVLLYFAQRTEGDAKIADADRFDTERGAEACAARLNQHWYLTSHGESASTDEVTPDEESGPASDDKAADEEG